MIFGRKKTIIALSALAFGLASCGKKKKSSSSDSNSDLTISGSLSLTGESSEGTSSSLALDSGFESSPSLDSFNLELTELSVFCVTFAFPPVAGTGTVGADGEFSLSISGGKDASIGCFILKGSTQVGTIVFEDPDEKDMSGANASSDKTSFAGNVKFGAIQLDLATGKAVVDLSKIEVERKVTGSAASLTDFTGTYKITALGLSQPEGYTAPCPAGSQGGNNDCHGPSEGEVVYFKRISGKDVESGADVFGVMAWESKTAFETCGSRLGISYNDAKQHAGVDLSGSGVNEGEFTWDTGFVDGWKSSSATLQHPRPLVRPLVVNGISGQAEGLYEGAQGTGAYTGFDFRPADNSQSGCRDASGKPVKLESDQWRQLVYDGNRVEIATGIYKNTGHLPDNSVSCTFVGGRFTKIATTFEAEVDGTFGSLNSNAELGRKNVTGSCSALSGEIEQARCHAEYLWSIAEKGQLEGKCIKRINYNWGAKTAAEFVNAGNGPVRAFGQHIFEKFRYDSPTSGSFRQEEERFEGLDTGNGWTDCRKIEKMNFALKAKDGSKDLLVEMTRESRNADPKPACIAASGKNQILKSLFIMTFVE